MRILKTLGLTWVPRKLMIQMMKVKLDTETLWKISRLELKQQLDMLDHIKALDLNLKN